MCVPKRLTNATYRNKRQTVKKIAFFLQFKFRTFVKINNVKNNFRIYPPCPMHVIFHGYDAKNDDPVQSRKVNTWVPTSYQLNYSDSSKDGHTHTIIIINSISPLFRQWELAARWKFFACPSFCYIRVGFFGSGVNFTGRDSWQRSRHCAATFLDECGAITPGPWRFLGFSRTGFTLHHRGRMQVHVLNCHPINSPGFRGNTLLLLLLKQLVQIFV